MGDSSGRTLTGLMRGRTSVVVHARSRPGTSSLLTWGRGLSERVLWCMCPAPTGESPGRRTDLSGGGRMRFSRGAPRTRDGRGDLGTARLVNDEDHNFVPFGW